MDKFFKNISCAILAGGKSSRYGKDKAFIVIDNDYLINRIVKKMKKYFDEVIIISDNLNKWKGINLDALVCIDKVKNIGPLEGIYTAINQVKKNDAVFVFACDMPFLDFDIIKSEVDFFNNSKTDIVVPKFANGFIEPLHAIYSCSIKSHLKLHLEKKEEYSIRSFLYGNYSLRLKFLELDQNEQVNKAFANINTESDFKKILRLKKSEK